MSETMTPIRGQVIYCGPTMPSVGLQYGTIFRNGIHPHLYKAIEECPALGGLFVPVKEYAAVRRQLNFDIARNMRGTSGKHVTFYREAQTWLATRARQSKAPAAASKGVKTHGI
jgi:hypothetical protein